MAAQTQPTVADASIITYPKVDRALISRVRHFDMERIAIQHFAQASMKAGGVPNLGERRYSDQLKRTRDYLDLLQFDTNMSPELNRKARIEGILMLINRDKIYFPDDVKQRADMLLQRFRDENWGAGAEAEEEDDDDTDDDEGTASPSTATAPVAPATRAGEPVLVTVTVRLPPAGHRIWGVNGIMDGIGKYKSLSLTFARL